MLFIFHIYIFTFCLIANVISTSSKVEDHLASIDSSNLDLLFLTNVNDEDIIRDQYSEIISHLVSKGHRISIKSFEKSLQDTDLSLVEYDELAYKNVVIFDIEYHRHMPSFPITLVPKILEYIDKGGNILVFTDTTNEKYGTDHNKGIRKLAKECADITFLPQNTQLIDVGINSRRDGYIYSNNCIDSEAFLSSGTCVGNGILYRGVGFSMNVPNSELIVPILSACDTCISTFNEIASANLKLFGNGIHSSTGEEIGLVVSMQARNNARATFSGDGQLCSNNAFTKNVNNINFCKNLLSWTFQQKGIIKISDIIHYRLNESPKVNENYDNTLMYTVEDTVFFSAKLHELVDNEWRVYRYNDIQLEFTMLDPYLRVFLHRNETNLRNTTFTAKFRVPETWGVFKFVINHNKLGYNSIFYESLATVRNFRHDQNPRFVISGFPYYASFICSVISLCYFTFLFIFYDFNYDTRAIVG
ncbi:dolichyl-diphosphooligosaccharide- glycosyltransferase beta subunit (Wbp1p) [Cryptosporidium bovis]|uniref:dolichyl-diphosphooligosaccharide- glycosyltransferase beta subunit (Wbp1p) n=1 Tax=Cryptosporidium bovis TaxID=310047 RepID=UPI00351A1ABB|nr:dolichyl-diphosphooligosaccharide- glycosyltransferase beta subunit (Wbp1p) [Cryptosporidium bovis]